MVIMKNLPRGALQKRTKMKSKIDLGAQSVIVIDDEVKPKVKKRKRKHLEQEKAADELTTRKKRVKKPSKMEKGFADHPIIIESSSNLKSLKEAETITIEISSDSESIKETGKAPKLFKKKRGRGFCHEQDRTLVVPTEDLSETYQEIYSLSRKTSKRTVLVNHGDDQEFVPKKKKKRKRQPICEEEDESRKPFSKKPKLTSQEGELLSEQKKAPILPNATRDCDVVKKKHKGICYSASVDSQGSSNGIGGDCHARTVSQLKQEPSCQERALGCRQHHGNGVENEMTQKKVKKKKKKKKKEKLKARDDGSVFADHQGGGSENLPGTKSGRKIVGMEDVTMLDTEGGGKKVKKKKKMLAQVENGCPAHLDRGVPTDGNEAAVKRVKKKKAKEVQDHNDHCGFPEEMCTLQVRKGKGRKSDSCREEPSWKKAKVEDEAKEEEEEIQVVAIKEGNCDEVSIDMLRRQALQDEIDRESGKTKAVREEGESDAHFGQWSTATFESLERKNKFLRLLGSFKNGSASTHSSPAHTTKPNMALAHAGEKHLLQNLQAEFDKARDLKQFRGRGLGFQPTAQKRTFIDKHASKSIKFEN
ncbi:lysine-rich nucleolar protein 1 [Tiliqua scincoides]|uniref:lysine-rich nucleolar protein 1 n=1 Tax=Tiliqua scincoides TaxID=71010 RepID=UPI003462C263